MSDHALAKLDRAAKHIAELNVALRDQQPFRYVYEENPQTGECSTFARRDEAALAQATGIASDAVQNLRTALDYAYFDIVSPLARTDRERRLVQFPFCISAAGLLATAKLRLADRVSDNFLKAVMDLGPHGEQRGNSLLYLIHELGTGDRHRFPPPVAEFKQVSLAMLRQQIPTFPPHLHGNPRLGGNAKDFVWRINPLPFLPDSAAFQRELDVPIDIVFQIKLDERQPMVGILSQMAEEAKKAIEIIRAA